MHKSWLVALVVPLGLAAVGSAWWFQSRTEVALARGDALFHGTTALTGRIVGHTVPLPTEVTRCANCHEALSSAAGPAASATRGRYGPALVRETLTQAIARRGGPPSRYDAAAMCALLRTGVDPAQVMIPQTMPRYEVGDADCEALWRYLVGR